MRRINGSVSVSVATSGTAIPEVSAPEVTTPEATTPEAITPEVTTPEATTPEAITPEATTPEVITPEVTTPEAITLNSPPVKSSHKTPIAPFVLYYAVIYMSVATFSPYINLYYRDLGYSIGQIGILTAIGPLVSIAAQPLWGVLSDRTDKKQVLVMVLTGALAATLLYALKTTFVYIAVMAVVYNACSSSAGPLGDALTLQFIENRNVKFSSIRLVGTISYAIMAAVAGRILTDGIGRIFAINAILLGAALLMAVWMPVVTSPADTEKTTGASGKSDDSGESGKSGAVGKQRGGLWVLLADKVLLCVYLSAFVFGLTMTFYHSFVGIRIAELGADTGHVGLVMLIAAASEIPVLLFIDRVFGKMKPVSLLILSGLFLALRMFLLFFATTVVMVYAAQVVHGLTFMVPYYFSVLLINERAPGHLKSTAQSVYTMFRSGVAAMLGTVGGGYLAEAVGIRGVYLFLAVFVLVACCIIPVSLTVVHNARTRR